MILVLALFLDTFWGFSQLLHQHTGPTGACGNVSYSTDTLTLTIILTLILTLTEDIMTRYSGAGE